MFCYFKYTVAKKESAYSLLIWLFKTKTLVIFQQQLCWWTAPNFRKRMATAAVNDIYHERQSLQLCAMHVINNLLQAKEFSKNELDEICLDLAPDSYSWWNPHRSPLGWGNYDCNVIMVALQRRGFDTIWFDKRR